MINSVTTGKLHFQFSTIVRCPIVSWHCSLEGATISMVFSWKVNNFLVSHRMFYGISERIFRY
jgi:hypothetical protein